MPGHLRIRFSDEQFANPHRTGFATMFTHFTKAAIVGCWLGLFALSVFTAAAGKEIGIRKIIGQ